ncbi:MAG: DUF134 domain-containing protein [Spirochaetales bacterium]|nr:DUF134 domain-containing protein [Spirochaetales bacterium]
MSRPPQERRLAAPIRSRVFKPAELPAGSLEEVVLGQDEAEALRLADLEGLYHEAAARSMGVSRPTFGRVLENARRKTAQAILEGKVLIVAGGEAEPSSSLVVERRNDFVVAAPENQGQIEDHYAQSRQFAIFHWDKEKLCREPDFVTPGGVCRPGIGAALAKRGVTHLVANHIGPGAVRILASHGITVRRGASGPLEPAVLELFPTE